MSVITDPTEVLRGEVASFIEEARRRSEVDPIHRRRADRRYHRSWPLKVLIGARDISAALHNASNLGLGFMSTLPVEPNTVVFLKLFCHVRGRPRVPAVVRHATPVDHGYLVGCEYLLNDVQLCDQAVRLVREQGYGMEEGLIH